MVAKVRFELFLRGSMGKTPVSTDLNLFTWIDVGRGAES